MRDIRKTAWSRFGLTAVHGWRSLRVRMQVFNAALLIAVVASFGGLLYSRAAQETMRQVDAQLEAAALVLDVGLRNFPPHELGRFPPEFGEKKWKQPPPPHGKKKREDFVAELALPPEIVERHGYYAIWQEDGSVVKSEGFRGEVRPATHLDPVRLNAKPFVLANGPYREAWMAGPLGTKILTGRAIHHDVEKLHAFGLAILGFGFVAVALGVGGGWLIANRLIRPIEAMSSAAAAISGDDLSARIDSRGIDTELAGLANVLNEMFVRLEGSFERQQQFTADASHELRTPLSIIRSQAELALSKPRTPEEYRTTLQTCLRAAQRMSNLAQGLLSLARVDAGKAFSFTNVRLHEIVSDSVAQMQAIADAKRVTLATDLEPIQISGNGQRLGQVVVNLVSNAIAFNSEGGRVEVRLFSDEENAVLTVRDNGIGIPARDCPKIFQRFFRVDKSRTRAVGGTGLGLAICKTFVEAHRGTIDFESTEGAGTTFRVRLPRANLDIKRMSPAEIRS
jgi:two-component system OmpR family sensor kinase